MFNKRSVRFFELILTATLVTSASVAAQDHNHDQAAHQQPPAAAVPVAVSGDPYLLDTDPVSGAKLGSLETQVVIQHEGRELRFASEETAKAFRTDYAKYLPAVDAALIKQQLPFYPPMTCPVSGEKLGEMGAPIDFVYHNRLVRFCCKSCKPAFLKDPGKYLDMVDQAVIAAQGPTYPVKACVVSDEALGGDMGKPVDVVVGNRLIRLCCAGCEKKVAADPLKYLGKLDAALAAGDQREGKASEPKHEHGSDHKDGDHR